MRTGLEVFLDGGLPELSGLRVGLITNHTGVDGRLRSGVDLLRESGRVELAALFGPEHGVRGEAQAGAHVGTATDARTGLPVHSLYGETRAPTPEMLRGLDALLFDIQDVGVRYATYASTMLYAQEAAAASGIPFAVLDRPNPLGGVRVEGPVLDPAFASFVGAYSAPVRHGLTLGELARLAAGGRDVHVHGRGVHRRGVQLNAPTRPQPLVAPLDGWERGQPSDETGLPWVQPSPNLPTLDSLSLYPGTCLLEGTNVSEGRGTTRPFELLGAPWLDPYALAEELGGRALPSVAFRPAWFTPVISKHAGESCGGVQVHIVDREELRPVELGVHLLHAVRRLAPDRFEWLRGADGWFFVDLLLGSDVIRKALDAGARVAEIIARWSEDERAFEERRRGYLLYD